MKASCLALLWVLGLAQADVGDHFHCLGGAPVGTTGTAAHSASPPFRIAVSDFPDSVPPGGRRTVTIRADRPFSGIFLRAHYMSGLPIGQWQVKDEGILLGLCDGPDDVLYTVNGPYRNSLTATWIAPITFLNHEIEFLATVIEPDGTYWTDIRSSIIPVSQSDAPVHQQPAQLPVQPGQPGQPAQPVVPAQPEEPPVPAQLPAQPAQPEEPPVPAQLPGEPVDPQVPVQPAQPDPAEPGQTPLLDPREMAPPIIPVDEESAPVQPTQSDPATGEDPLEPARIAQEQHDTAIRHDTEGATAAEQPPADQPVVSGDNVHDSRREDEMEAAWQEKRAQMIDNEEANSEGAFNRVELEEREAHEKEIHEEQMAYEREQEQREKIRMERLRAEIRDKEEYDRLKAEQERRLEEERLRELEREMDRKLQEIEKAENTLSRENDAVKSKVTAGVSRTSLSLAAVLTILAVLLL